MIDRITQQHSKPTVERPRAASKTFDVVEWKNKKTGGLASLTVFRQYTPEGLLHHIRLQQGQNVVSVDADAVDDLIDVLDGPEEDAPA